jgi:hypothetical protein
MLTQYGGCHSDLHTGRAVIKKLVDSQARPTRIKHEYVSIWRLVTELRFMGFRVYRNELFGPATGEYGTPGGRMLFLVKGAVLVRIKTHGGKPAEFGARKQVSAAPWWIKRSGVAHMTVSLVRVDKHGRPDASWDGEQAKFDVDGELVPKSPGESDAEIWSDLTHFNFPDLYCDDSGVDGILPNHVMM